MPPIITSIQVICIITFLYASVSLSVTSAISIGLFIACIFLQRRRGSNVEPEMPKPHQRFEALSPDERAALHRRVYQYMTYDAPTAPTLEGFEVIKNNTQCIFAKTAKLWGNLKWDKHLSLEENVERILSTFFAFSCVCEKVKLDGFVFELPGDIYGQNIEDFSEAVCRTLTIISNNDPAGKCCMNKPYIDKLGWVFEFNKITMFVTTFAPFYSENHPRFTFGARDCYILFQPEVSFVRHDLGPERSRTEWDDPLTPRDRIRCAYLAAGRPYHVPPESPRSPVALEVVKPLEDDGQSVVRWWDHREGRTGRAVVASLDDAWKIK